MARITVLDKLFTNIWRSMLAFGIFFIIGGLMSIFPRGYIDSNISSIFMYLWIISLVVTGGMFFICLFGIPIILFYGGTVRKISNTILDKSSINRYLSKIESLKDAYLETGKILEFNKEVLKIINRIKFCKKLLGIHYDTKEKENIKDYALTISDRIIVILKDLQGDLIFQLKKNKDTLIQAETEIKKYIHGKDELNRASEIQLARLDKQIEQFEELQKILIKT